MEIEALKKRIEALEKRLEEINQLIEVAEQKRSKTIIEWLDGPIMSFGKHDIKDEDLNKKETK